MLNLIKGESSVEDVKKVLLTKSKRSKMEQRGKFFMYRADRVGCIIYFLFCR